jgi:hypothetical protein
MSHIHTYFQLMVIKLSWLRLKRQIGHWKSEKHIRKIMDEIFELTLRERPSHLLRNNIKMYANK